MTRQFRQELHDGEIVELLEMWIDGGGETALWVIGPSGKHYPRPTWAEAMGFEFYDAETEADWSHYYSVRRLEGDK